MLCIVTSHVLISGETAFLKIPRADELTQPPLDLDFGI